MRLLGIGVIALHLGLVPGSASAERTEVLFQLRSWVVEAVTADDDSFACYAKVAVPGNGFSIRPLPDRTIRIEFFSEEWFFGEGETANVEVEIVGQTPWAFSGATLLQNSVFVDLSDLDESKTFVNQVARGNTLLLRAADGTNVRTYSLSGSSEAIRNLANCTQMPARDRNPFN